MTDSCDTGATRITLKVHGPAFPLRVWYDFYQEMSIDIVPAIRLNDRLFVSKRHPHATDSPLDLYNNMWRESFSKQEKYIIKTMDRKKECRKKCLKILKTIQIVNPSEQLRFLSSYHLKTCMLHLNNECVEPWDEEYIGDRFRDLLLVLNTFLERGVMESFFDPGIDLFAGLSEDGIQSTGGWLNKIVSSDDQIIEQLLHRVKQSESESLGSPEWRGMIDLNMNTYDDVFYDDLESESNSSVEALCSEDYNPAYYAPNEKVDIEAQRPLIHKGRPTEQVVEMKKPTKQRSCACCLIS
ncbi:mitochondrial dynamics protein MID51-like [Antedon mediterranea]|uniref:mitochondrial dynamics protein MID51-like n=1 Tax=Antedon mediterranea TaxID=105859 RepID=UPI003AF5C4BC